MHRLIPEDSAEGSVVKAGEEAHNSLCQGKKFSTSLVHCGAYACKFGRLQLTVVVLADLLSDESSFVLVVDGKTGIHVDLIDEGCARIQEGLRSRPFRELTCRMQRQKQA